MLAASRLILSAQEDREYSNTVAAGLGGRAAAAAEAQMPRRRLP
jgi:hypothetical protein